MANVIDRTTEEALARIVKAMKENLPQILSDKSIHGKTDTGYSEKIAILPVNEDPSYSTMGDIAKFCADFVSTYTGVPQHAGLYPSLNQLTFIIKDEAKKELLNHANYKVIRGNKGLNGNCNCDGLKIKGAEEFVYFAFVGHRESNGKTDLFREAPSKLVELLTGQSSE